MFRHHPDTPYSCFSNDPVVRSRIAIISIFCQEALTPTPTLLTSRAESLLTGALACGTCTYLYKVCILLHLSEPYKHDHTCLDLSTMMVRRIVYCSCMKRLKKMLSWSASSHGFRPSGMFPIGQPYKDANDGVKHNCNT
jgi:hypothetical protein